MKQVYIYYILVDFEYQLKYIDMELLAINFSHNMGWILHFIDNHNLKLPTIYVDTQSTKCILQLNTLT